MYAACGIVQLLAGEMQAETRELVGYAILNMSGHSVRQGALLLIYYGHILLLFYHSLLYFH